MRQLRELNQVAARVVQHRNGRCGDIGRRHRELAAASLDPGVVPFDIIGVEHHRRLMLIENRPLISAGRRIAVLRQLQLSAVGLFGGSDSQPRETARY